MGDKLQGAPLYALIDRMRDLQRKQRLLRWLPFCGKRKAAIASELATINGIMFPPIWCESAGMWV